MCPGRGRLAHLYPLGAGLRDGAGTGHAGGSRRPTTRSDVEFVWSDPSVGQAAARTTARIPRVSTPTLALVAGQQLGRRVGSYHVARRRRGRQRPRSLPAPAATRQRGTGRRSSSGRPGHDLPLPGAAVRRTSGSGSGPSMAPATPALEGRSHDRRRPPGPVTEPRDARGSVADAREAGRIGRHQPLHDQQGCPRHLPVHGPQRRHRGAHRPWRGKARIIVDGKRVAVIDLRGDDHVSASSSGPGPGRPRADTRCGSRSLGTDGRPRVDLDAFLVMR